ncbi:MAG: SpaA isopeptide-forming pilin-related protein, partial [Eubacteriales bacterium]|nr:SpaA isopeptide-forming pilin-related protein [Eubacteriales bacterium]
FHFKVTVYGEASVPGQLTARQIDSETGFYGEMDFHSDGVYATVAEFDLMPGESVTAVNLSEGLHYEVEEVLTEEQARKYAVLPAVKLSGLIGENKGRTDIDPYTSALVYTNRLPVCKLTDQDGNLLYRRITVDAGNGEKSYNVPAVYLNLEDGFKAVEDALTATGSQADRKLYTGEDLDSQSYAVSQGVKLELLVSTTLNEAQTVVENETLTLTTASKLTDEFPFRGSGSMATVWRDFPDGSMLTVDSGAALSITGITVDGSKSQYTVSSDGGAVYVKSGAVLSVSDSVIQNHQIDADHNGAGIYLEAGSRLNLSGNLDFGGKGTEVTGRIKPSGSSMGNFKNTTLPDGSKNGGWEYTTPRQDIYLAEANENAPQDIVITGDLSGDNGCIWVWAASEYHYKQNMPFARLADGVDGGNLMVFRNARPDDETENGTDTWLYGCLDEDNYPGYVCWSGVKGSRRVILRKVDASLQSLAGAQFDVHRGSPDGQIVTIKYDDGTTETLENLSSNAKGILWVGDLPYGTYFLHEKNPVNAWFALIVDDPEFVAPDSDPFISGPHDSDGAISAANAKNLEIKAAKQAARTP